MTASSDRGEGGISPSFSVFCTARFPISMVLVVVIVVVIVFRKVRANKYDSRSALQKNLAVLLKYLMKLQELFRSFSRIDPKFHCTSYLHYFFSYFRLW